MSQDEGEEGGEGEEGEEGEESEEGEPCRGRLSPQPVPVRHDALLISLVLQRLPRAVSARADRTRF